LQICVSPDYILVPREKQDELVSCFKQQIREFYPEGALNSQSFGRMVSEAHFNRIKGLLQRTKGEIVFGGGTNDKRGIEPTIVKNVTGDDVLMEECGLSFIKQYLISDYNSQRDIWTDYSSHLCKQCR
jgi:acyl-CoA reductase-like NAD-dependent aldehyde dehydrogenase